MPRESTSKRMPDLLQDPSGAEPIRRSMTASGAADRPQAVPASAKNAARAAQHSGTRATALSTGSVALSNLQRAFVQHDKGA